MATLPEILDDKKQYPDDQKITISGVETTLGDLRSGYLRQADYTKKTMKLSDEQREFERRQAEFEAARAVAEQKLEAMATQILRREPNTGEAELEARLAADPIAKRLNDQVKTLTEQITTLGKSVTETQEAINQSRRANLVDQHRRVLAVLKQNDPSLDEEALIAYAKENSIPRLDLAYRLMTEEERTAKAVKEAKETAKAAGLEEGKRLAVQPLIPQIRLRDVPKPDAPKTIEDAFDAASRDPDIINLLSGASG